jgi:hypothetical protein
MWLILSTKKCGGMGRIDVTTDVYMKVSRVKEFYVTIKNQSYALT